MDKKVLVLGAGGFIGSHLVRKLKSEGCWVRGVDLKYPEFSNTEADDFVITDLRSSSDTRAVIDTSFSEIYQLAADMGGAGYIFTGENDADVMHNSALINLNVLDASRRRNNKKLFYSSSACVYPEYNQLDPDNPKCDEASAYPAAPDSEYGWEKLFSERLYFAYARNYGFDVHIARYHNIYGPEGTWDGGKEKAPAALCRKIIRSSDFIEIWGDGHQTRSFLYIDDCIEATVKFMRSSFNGPLNIGSDFMISLNDFASMIIKISGKKIKVKNINGPEGVRGRFSDNKLINEKLNWNPSISLECGINKTYNWIKSQIDTK
jgi:GDP-D-mannose 3',5'-epimerase